MADESSVQQGKKHTSVQQRKKRKGKKFKSYAKFTIHDAEKRVGVIFATLEENAIFVEDMLDGQSKALGEDAIDEIKRKVYDNIIDYLDTEGYPSEAREHFNEANINDLVYTMIAPIISGFRRQTGRKSLQLHRERQIIAVGSKPEAETGRVKEFMVMDLISITDEKFIIVIEAKECSVGQALKQCLLSMFDMRGNNGSGKIYGFITTGEYWRMISFDGTSFQLTSKFHAMFAAMKNRYEKWEKEYSLLVDCMVFALSDGGGIVNTEAKGDGGIVNTEAKSDGGIVNTEAKGDGGIVNTEAKSDGRIVNTEAKVDGGIVNTKAKSDGGIVNTEAKNDQKFSTIRTSITPHRLLHTLASTTQQIQSNSGSRPAKTIAATAAATILPNLANSNKTATKQTATNFVPLKAHYPQDVLPWGIAASVDKNPILRPTKYVAGVMTQPTRIPPTHLMLTGVNENKQFQMSRPGDRTLPRPHAWPQPVIATSAPRTMAAAARRMCRRWVF